MSGVTFLSDLSWFIVFPQRKYIIMRWCAPQGKNFKLFFVNFILWILSQFGGKKYAFPPLFSSPFNHFFPPTWYFTISPPNRKIYTPVCTTAMHASLFSLNWYLLKYMYNLYVFSPTSFFLHLKYCVHISPFFSPYFLFSLLLSPFLSFTSIRIYTENTALEWK